MKLVVNVIKLSKSKEDECVNRAVSNSEARYINSHGISLSTFRKTKIWKLCEAQEGDKSLQTKVHLLSA